MLNKSTMKPSSMPRGKIWPITLPSEMVAAQNVAGKDCSMFELTDEEQSELVNDNTAFMQWLNKPAN